MNVLGNLNILRDDYGHYPSLLLLLQKRGNFLFINRGAFLPRFKDKQEQKKVFVVGRFHRPRDEELTIFSIKDDLRRHMVVMLSRTI